MDPVVEIVRGGTPQLNKMIFSSFYNDPGSRKMVIVQDDDKFPSPRLCLLRRWPNFEGGFGFEVGPWKAFDEDVATALKVEEVKRHSPAEAGGLRRNDIIVEINGDNIEFKSFVPLVELLKEACSQNEMELLVLAEQDAKWYKVHNISVNSRFPNIEYCETPYLAHKLRPLEPNAPAVGTPKTGSGSTQIEFHSSSGKLYRTTLVIDKDNGFVYRRIEELPSGATGNELASETSLPVYYRRDRTELNTGRLSGTTELEQTTLNVDSGHGTITNRRDTPLSQTGNLGSPYSTLGREQGVDLLHDKWADLMDQYLDNKFKSAIDQSIEGERTMKRNNVIKLNDPNLSSTMRSNKSTSRSRAQSPNVSSDPNAAFSYLKSGLDDYQTASATSFRELHSRSPYHRGSPHTQSYNRYTSPPPISSSILVQSMQSPTRIVPGGQARPSSRPASSTPQTVQNVPQTSQLQQQQDTSISSFSQSSYHQSQPTTSQQHQSYYDYGSQQQQQQHPVRDSSSTPRYPQTATIQTTTSSPIKTGVNASYSLGFRLDEQALANKNVFIVKYVEPGTPSAMAGLKEGDKITKINGRSTQSMPYDEFCREIVIAQQQQMRNNMIHLMVMRKSAKATGTGTYSATTTSNSSSSMLSPPVLSTSKYHATTTTTTHEKSSSFDEGYIPGSATSSSSTNFGGVTSATSPYGTGSNLISVVKVNQYDPQPQPQRVTYKPGEQPSYSSSYESYVKSSNVIYDSQNGQQIVEKEEVSVKTEKITNASNPTAPSTTTTVPPSTTNTLTTSTNNNKPSTVKPAYKQLNTVEIHPIYSPSTPIMSVQKREPVAEKEERDRVEKAAAVERDRAERDRAERDRAERERQRAEEQERERAAAAERAAAERERLERLEKQRAADEERERAAAAERERLERERAEELRKRERELAEAREREKREREAREQRERELQEAWEREKREREEREKREREEREREAQRERERLERELREAREREERQRAERERLEKERAELERIERERALERERAERERQERERAERERFERERAERERQERERAERERAEREQLERELAAERERQERERAEREREEREKLAAQNVVAPTAVTSALAALTTIVNLGNQPQQSSTQPQQQPNDKFEIPISSVTKSDTVYSRYPVQEIIDDTTTKIQEIYEVHQYKREEITRYSPTQATAQDATDFLNTSGSITEPNTQYHELESDQERLRREYAENEFVRQQEVMLYLIDAMDNPKLEDKLRTYSLYKSQHYFGYGIAFHTESIPATLPSHKLVYPLVEIEANSPADEAAMRNGQRVVAVNGAFVNKEFRTLEDVVQAIEDSYYTRNFTEITVIDPDLWHECMQNPSYAAELARLTPTKDTKQTPIHHVTETFDKSVPRLCRLTRQSRSDQYGFDFKTLKSEGRHVANNVRPGLPADRAGLRDGDYILEVNGESLENMEHDAVVNKISSNPNQVDLLVVGDYQAYLGNRKTTTKPVYKEPTYDGDEVNMDLRLPAPDVIYHPVKLIPTFKGLGISLTPNGIISAIEPNSPSDLAGLKKDDRIVEVNGIDVRERTNKEIARIIKEHEHNLIIGVSGWNVERDSYRPPSSTGNLSKIMGEIINDQAPPVTVTPTFRPAPSTPITTTPTPATDGTTHLKSIIGEMIQSSGSAEPLPTSPAPHIRSIIAEITSMQAPQTTQIAPTPTPGSITGSRICTIWSRPDYDGFGFSMRANQKGPHQISSVEPKSPAEDAGLRVEDLILKVNDVPVVGERYSKTVTVIKNESERGRLKLEVIDPAQCPKDVRNTALNAPSSDYSTITSSGKLNKKAGSIQNLTAIAREAGAGSSDRAQSVDAANRTRPLSMSDAPQYPYPTGRDTVTSFGSVLLTEPQNQTGLMSQSTGTLNAQGRFKRCNIQLPPDAENQSFGFTLNSKVKPKYMIFSVDQGSPAYNANLRSSDVIVAVDKTNIRRLKFDKVKSMLSDAKRNGHVEILAVTKENYLYYKNKKKRFSSSKLVTSDNTDLYAYPQPGYSLSGTIRTRDLSSDNEGDRDYSTYNRSQTPNEMQTSTYEGVPSNNNLRSESTTRIETAGGRVEVTTTTNAAAPGTPIPSNRSPSAPAATTTTTNYDDFEIVECVIQRSSPQQPLGLSLANQTANLGSTSLSRNSNVSFRDEQLPGPLITKVDANSLAEQSGLRAGDTVLEINGTKTNGLTNKSIANLITSAGNEITFLVGRKRLTPAQIGFVDDAAIRESALRITRDTIAEAKSRVQQQQQEQPDEYQSGSQSGSPAIGQRHVSRRDSQNQSPKLLREEIKLSSSKLYGAYPDTHSTSSLSQSPPLTTNSYQQQPAQQTPSPSASRYRNQSEPPPANITTATMPSASSSTDLNRSSYNPYTTDQQLQQSSAPIQQPSPVSRRSSSSYTLPSDAPIPRLCRVRAYEQQLGFTIAGSKANKGVFKISDVSPNSPAAHAGLQNDDYIIEISGQNVQNMQYSEVVEYIKAKKQEDDLQLLVADRLTLDWYKNKKLPIASQIVPKMQYIETLLKEELDRDTSATDDVNRSLSDNLGPNKGFKIPLQSGRSVWIKRKIYLCPPVEWQSATNLSS